MEDACGSVAVGWNVTGLGNGGRPRKSMGGGTACARLRLGSSCEGWSIFMKAVRREVETWGCGVEKARIWLMNGWAHA